MFIIHEPFLLTVCRMDCAVGSVRDDYVYEGSDMPSVTYVGRMKPGELGGEVTGASGTLLTATPNLIQRHTMPRLGTSTMFSSTRKQEENSCCSSTTT